MDAAKRKRLQLAAAAAAVLAIVVIMSRRSSTAGAAATDTSALSPSSPAGVSSPGPTTFADNGAALGALSTELSGSLGQVGVGLGQVDSSLTGLQGSVDALPDSIAAAVAAGSRDPGVPTAAPGPLAAAGQPAAAPQAAARVDRYGRTVKERQAISSERRAGDLDKHGRTPTERRVAEGNADYNKALHAREKKKNAAKRADRTPTAPARHRDSPSQRRPADPPVHKSPHKPKRK
jgi:hypothetical protein